MCRALLTWEMLRTEARLPLDGSLDLAGDPDLAAHLYLVRLNRPLPSSTLHCCGTELARLCHGYADGAALDATLPIAVRERMIDFIASTTSYRQPLADSGEFPGHDGRDIMYRNILLPMQNASGAVVSIVGAFSYRTLP